jgi:hypothetical protein
LFDMATWLNAFTSPLLSSLVFTLSRDIFTFLKLR